MSPRRKRRQPVCRGRPALPMSLPGYGIVWIEGRRSFLSEDLSILMCTMTTLDDLPLLQQRSCMCLRAPGYLSVIWEQTIRKRRKITSRNTPCSVMNSFIPLQWLDRRSRNLLTTLNSQHPFAMDLPPAMKLGPPHLLELRKDPITPPPTMTQMSWCSSRWRVSHRSLNPFKGLSRLLNHGWRSTKNGFESRKRSTKKAFKLAPPHNVFSEIKKWHSRPTSIKNKEAVSLSYGRGTRIRGRGEQQLSAKLGERKLNSSATVQRKLM